MAETKITKQKLKELINKVNFIDESEKSKWIELIENLNPEEISKVFKYFKQNQKQELDTALAIIFEDDMEENLHEEIDKITQKYIKKFKK